MRPLRYSINLTLDGCCDHRTIQPDDELHRRAAETLARADALLFGRVTYPMMEEAWRPPAEEVGRPAWMEPFAHVIDAAKKYVVSSTLDRVDWNAELVTGSLEQSNVQPTEVLIEMVEAQRMFDIRTKLISTARELDEGSASLMRVNP